jgi:hypothetical protein
MGRRLPKHVGDTAASRGRRAAWVGTHAIAPLESLDTWPTTSPRHQRGDLDAGALNIDHILFTSSSRATRSTLHETALTPAFALSATLYTLHHGGPAPKDGGRPFSTRFCYISATDKAGRSDVMGVLHGWRGLILRSRTGHGRIVQAPSSPIRFGALVRYCEYTACNCPFQCP